MEGVLSVSEPASRPTGAAPAAVFCAEDDRLAILASFDAGGLVGDAELSRIVRFAARLCGAPSATLSIVEAERQRFLAREGIDASETPRSTSFCAHAMLGGDILEVLDASADARFSQFALVRGEPQLRYYAGAPLVSSEGAPLGALCVIDTRARTQPLDKVQREGLQVLADAAKRRLEAHRQAKAADIEMRDSAARLHFMLDSVPDIAWSAAPGPVFDYFNARFTEVTGKPPRECAEDWREVIHPEDFDASLEKFTHALENAAMFEDQWRLRLADGSYRWVLSRAVPSSDDPQTARWFGTLTDIDVTHRISQERELLAGELAHRIKNIFSVIIGLITLHARGNPAVGEFGAMLSDNVRALARAQEFALKVDDKEGEDLKSLMAVLMAPYGVSEGSAVQISGEPVPVGRRAATPLALVFHELATNSAKYGALSVAEGKIAIAIHRTESDVTIRWEETGGPAAIRPETTGFGSRLLRMAIDHQLGGQIEHDWRPEGLQATITIPCTRLAD